MKLTVRQIPRQDIYKDMVRIPETYRLDVHDQKIPEGTICKLSMLGRGKLLAVRGRLGMDRQEVFMDDKTRADLKVECGQDYDFQIRRTSWVGHIFWSARASDPAYRIPAKIALVSLILGVVGIALGILSVLLSIHSSRQQQIQQAAKGVSSLQEQKSGVAANPRDWFIESWNLGALTVQHEGYEYRATCHISRSFNNAPSITDPNNVHTFQTCDLALDFIGRNVQPFEGKRREPDGWTVNMWNSGTALALRRWKDEHTLWRQEGFVISSVKKAQ